MVEEDDLLPPGQGKKVTGEGVHHICLQLAQERILGWAVNYSVPEYVKLLK